MATLCKNCGRPITFDPYSQKLSCDFCGSKFTPGSVREYGQELAEDIVPERVEDKELMDCYVYHCSSCGGEVIVNGTEASTTCIYCGSPSVVFSRISKQRRPDCIIPFKITKEEALDEVRKRFKKGIFIPKRIKRFKTEDVRGIYLPYWVVNADHYGSMALQGTFLENQTNDDIYYARSGSMKIKGLPVDATGILSPDSSSRLEPYNTKVMKPFDENYLLGFYSNTADISFGTLEKRVGKRAEEIFFEFAIKDIYGARGLVVASSEPDTSIDYSNIRYAMFPAWFITYRHKGQHNTILVNGETGKVVCGVPWNKGFVISLYAASGIFLSVLAFFFFKEFLELADKMGSSGYNTTSYYGLLAMLFASFTAGFAKVRSLKKSLELTQSASVFNFVKKRQG